MTDMSLYQQYIALSRYARWIPEENRRETWQETVDRYIEFWKERLSYQWEEGEVTNLQVLLDGLDESREAIFNLEAMPSMRCLMTAGKALAKDNMAGYNCSYIAVDHPRVFDEILYVLMCGTGVGFSVERQSIQKLPVVAEEFHPSETVISVRDSKIGWATAYRELIAMLYAGQYPSWDVSRVRAAGERLKTFGGRASGPEPLVDLFKFTQKTFMGAAGRKLSSIECHDLVCKIAQIVVVGGVRRSALISLSNLSDDRMRHAKNGQWWDNEPQRALANNSYVANERPEFEVFLNEWKTLYESKSGERGIFSRVASQKQAEKSGRRDPQHEFGTNPCSEIILRSAQVCNLSEVVVRAGDTLDDLKKKVRLATILGTLQSTLTDFRYVRSIWAKNTAEERLLGVSMTGICDHEVLGDPDHYLITDWLSALKEVAIDTNKEWADLLRIEQSTAITCVKPSGTVSQLTDTASGIHPRFSPYYIRRVRGDSKDPMSEMMQQVGIPSEVDVMNPNALVFDFPQKAPENAVCVRDVSAMDQLKLWEIYQDYWCEHKPSATIYFSDNEFLEVGQWVWDRIDKLSGISFLPRVDHVYAQAPYEEIDESAYEALLEKMPALQTWDGMLQNFETQDGTTGTQELACSAGVCEVVDITESGNASQPML